MGLLVKSRGLRMSTEKQETLLKLSILSLAAILCEYSINHYFFLSLKNID